jgi:O-antigen/teichoic acid export membrane protein
MKRVGGRQLLRVRLRRPERLTISALALMTNTGITSMLGVVFWAAAARLYNPATLGEDAGLIAAMMLISSVSDLSLSQGIPRFLPQLERRRARAVLSAYVATGAVAVVLAFGFVALVPNLSPGFAFLKGEPQLAMVLVGSAALWTVFALQDAVLVAVRRAVLVPIENAFFGALKIVLMVVFGLFGHEHGVILGWVLAMTVVVPPINWLLFTRLLRPPGQASTNAAPLLPLSDRSRVTRYLAGDYAGSLVSQGSTILLPVLVLAVLGGAASAYFYVAFTIAGALNMLALAVSTSLVVEAAHDELRLASLTAQALLRWATLLVPAMVLLAVAAPLVLRPFGAAYAENAAALLRLLILGSVPQTLVIVYLGTERARGHAGHILAVQCLSLGIMVVALNFLMNRGLEGVGMAWVITWAVTAITVLPRLYTLVGPSPAAVKRSG